MKNIVFCVDIPVTRHFLHVAMSVTLCMSVQGILFLKYAGMKMCIVKFTKNNAAITQILKVTLSRN